MYTAPTANVVINDQTFTFTADLHAFMTLHEMLISHPEWYQPAMDENGEVIGGRLKISADVAPFYFAAFCKQLDPIEWTAIVLDAHPREVLVAWQKAEEIIQEADWNGGGSETDPFRPEPA